MAHPYSVRFLLAANLNNSAVTYTVPAGRRAVITNILMYAAVTGNVGYVAINGLPFAFYAASAVPQSPATTTRVVAYAGEVIKLHLYNSANGGVVSGYLLDDTVGKADVDQEYDGTSEPLPPPTVEL